MAEDGNIGLTDHKITNLVTGVEDEMETESTVNAVLVTHAQGFLALETAFEYIEGIPTDIALFRRWRDIAAQKRVMEDQFGQSRLDCI